MTSQLFRGDLSGASDGPGTSRLLFALAGAGAIALLGALWAGVPGWALLALPALLVALLAALSGPRKSALFHLTAVLGASVVSLKPEPGFQISEVIYGVYYLGYLAVWFGTRLSITREAITAYAGDRSLLAFLGFALISGLWSFPIGADLKDYVSGITALAFLGFYFPIREALLVPSRGPQVLAGLLLCIGLFVVLRNLVMYEQLVAQAVTSDFIRNRRVDMNNSVVLSCALLSMALLAYSGSWRTRILFGVLTVLFCLGIVITLSRALWVVTIAGLLLIPLLSRGRQRVVASMWLAAGSGISLLLLIVLAGDKFSVIAEGLISRFSSLSGAATRDISLLARLFEGEAALDTVGLNVLLGQGVGASFSWWDIILQHTSTVTFIHNGFISILFRFGIVGSVLMATAWGGGLRRGLLAVRAASLPPHERAIAMGGVITLICTLVYATTSNPLHNSDSILMLTYAMALAAGIHGRYQLVRQHDASSAPASPIVS